MAVEPIGVGEDSRLPRRVREQLATEVADPETEVGASVEAAIAGSVGELNDPAVAGLIDDTGSDTRASLNATIESLGAPMAKDGHRYTFYAGVIRNDGTGWALLPENTNHRPINIDSITTDGQKIRVNYETAGATMTVTFLAVPDETLTKFGFHCGTSVGPTFTDIYLAQSARAASDYVTYDGTNWVSQDGVFQNIVYSAGKLHLEHFEIPQAAQYAVSLEARDLGYRYQVSASAQPTSRTHLDIDIHRERAVSDYVYFDGTNWVSQNGVYSATFSAGLLTLQHTAVPIANTYDVSVVPRGGAYTAAVHAGAGAIGTTNVALELRGTDGELATVPDVNMKFFVSHGGGLSAKIGTPEAGMKLYVSHGGGTRNIDPTTVTTTAFPLSNIWLFGIMGQPDAE